MGKGIKDYNSSIFRTVYGLVPLVYVTAPLQELFDDNQSLLAIHLGLVHTASASKSYPLTHHESLDIPPAVVAVVYFVDNYKGVILGVDRFATLVADGYLYHAENRIT